MGPICDKLGLEQGGKNSDKFYRLCNNSQLKVAQQSGLGVDMGVGLGNDLGVGLGNDMGVGLGVNIANGINLASIGQADDVV